MRRMYKVISIACVLGVGVSLGAMGDPLVQVVKRGSQAINFWDQTVPGTWPSSFSVVQIDAGESGTQNAMYKSSEVEAPLIVSLHTWSGNYAQSDPLAEKISSLGWNYIRPNLRGPNNTREACLSELVTLDFDQAIDFAIENGNVDMQRIYVVGASGGGYAALGAYLQSQHPISHYFVWVPITDLEAWYFQSEAMGTRYANDILNCTESDDELNSVDARSRSPIHMPVDDEWSPKPL